MNTRINGGPHSGFHVPPACNIRTCIMKTSGRNATKSEVSSQFFKNAASYISNFFEFMPYRHPRPHRKQGLSAVIFFRANAPPLSEEAKRRSVT
ncbi:hypothetical protein [Rhizobium binxianense]